MSFYVIIFIAVILPYILPNKYKQKGLLISMMLLFIPWGLQYEICNDWFTNLGRWRWVNYDEINMYVGKEGIEPVYVFLLSIFKPIGFFGWLMVSAIIELSLFYYLITKFVNRNYYWLSIFVLMTNVSYGLLFINSNRQTLSAICLVVGSLILLYNHSKLKYLYSLSFFIIGPLIHGASFAGYILLLVILFVNKYKDLNIKWLLLICNIIFFSRFFIRDSTFLYELSEYYSIQGPVDKSGYFEDLEYTKNRDFSIPQLFFPYFIMNGLILLYNKFTKFEKFFSLCYILSLLIKGFVLATLGRVTMYMDMFALVTIPLLPIYMPNFIKNLKIYYNLNSVIRVMFYLFIIYYCYRIVHDTSPLYHSYENWSHFKTIFSANKWI